MASNLETLETQSRCKGYEDHPFDDGCCRSVRFFELKTNTDKMKTKSTILNRFAEMKITALAAMAAAALLSTPAHAFDTDNDGDDFQFDLIRSAGLNPFPSVAPNAHGSVKLNPSVPSKL